MGRNKDAIKRTVQNPVIQGAPPNMSGQERSDYIQAQTLKERQSYDKVSGGSFFRFLVVICFGATLFTSVTTRFNLVYITFGVLVFFVFIFLYKHLLRSFLGLFNPVVKKEIGKRVILAAVDNSLLFLIPFAVMSLIATYFLKWSIANAFISTGIMAVGTAASIEVGKLRDKPAIKNMVVTSALSFLFSLGLTVSIQLLTKIPGLIEGVFSLIPTLLGKGGGGI